MEIDKYSNWVVKSNVYANVYTNVPSTAGGSVCPASGLSFLGVRMEAPPVPGPVPRRITWAGLHGFLLPTCGTSGLGTLR